MKNNWVSKLTAVMMASALLVASAVAVPSASAKVVGGATSDVIGPVDDANTGTPDTTTDPGTVVTSDDEEMYSDVNAVEEDLSDEQPGDLIFKDGKLFPRVPTHPAPGDVLDGTSSTTALSTRDKMANLAVSKIGSKYVWGAAGPKQFDCSGFTMWIYDQNGYSLPHSSSSQSKLGTAVSISNLVKGDLLFYGTGSVSHVAMYIGDGYMVHAENENTGVVKTSINNSWYKSHFITARHFNIK